jgi:hypothetical protein
MKVDLKTHKNALCYTCLVRAKCSYLCQDQAGIMVDNTDEYFSTDIKNIIENSGLDREYRIKLVVGAENACSDFKIVEV